MTVRLITGDCRQVLPTLPPASVHCVVTSPPYWGLRSYLPDDDPDKPLEIGSEPTLDEWVQTLVGVFRQVRRVLRDDGTCWINLGDSYAGSRCGVGDQSDSSTLQGGRATQQESRRAKVSMTASRRRDDHPIPRSDVALPGLKPKDRMGQPWRIALALQADGWYWRDCIVWHKLNPMPESARDRLTQAWEPVLLLTKTARYAWNFDDIQEQASENTHARRRITPANWATCDTPHTSAAHCRPDTHRKLAPKDAGRSAQGLRRSDALGRGPGWRVKSNQSFDTAMAGRRAMRNPRNVWSIATQPFSEAHFATFPPELARRCIAAGCPPGGMVLDPFGGAGTVGMVADAMQRHAVLIELGRHSIDIADRRIRGDAPLFAEVLTT
jgi:DNA modification methylase